MRVDAAVVGLAGREVYADNPRRHLVRPYVASADLDTFQIDQVDILRTELTATATDRAREAARQLFLWFGLDLTPEVLRGVQEEVVPEQGGR